MGKASLKEIVNNGPKPKGRARKQTEIPGAEREVDEEIEQAIEALVNAKTERTAAKAAVEEATDELRELMTAKGVEAYVSVELERKVERKDREARVSLTRFAAKETTSAEAAE